MAHEARAALCLTVPILVRQPHGLPALREHSLQEGLLEVHASPYNAERAAMDF